MYRFDVIISEAQNAEGEKLTLRSKELYLVCSFLELSVENISRW